MMILTLFYKCVCDYSDWHAGEGNKVRSSEGWREPNVDLEGINDITNCPYCSLLNCLFSGVILLRRATRSTWKITMVNARKSVY